MWHLQVFYQQMTMAQDPSGEWWKLKNHLGNLPPLLPRLHRHQWAKGCFPFCSRPPNRTALPWNRNTEDKAGLPGCVVSVSESVSDEGRGRRGIELPVTLTSITAQHIGRSRMKDWFKQFHLRCLCALLQPALFSSRLRIHASFCTWGMLLLCSHRKDHLY